MILDKAKLKEDTQSVSAALGAVFPACWIENMRKDYPNRPMAPNVARYCCMIFGVACMIGAIASGRQDPSMLVGAVLIGSAWFAFGAYGGYPLIDTVPEWCPPSIINAVEEIHLQGLLVMRRRKWMAWLTMPCGLAAAVLLMPSLMKTSHPELVVFLVGIPLFLINMRYYLSRCPRCGLGFFTRSSSRAAFIRKRHSCGHCGLSLNAYKR